MYLIGIKDGKHRCGNDGSMITRAIGRYDIMYVAERWAKQTGNDEVYGSMSYSQKMCEMENDEFVEYVRKNCIKYV